MPAHGGLLMGVGCGWCRCRDGVQAVAGWWRGMAKREDLTSKSGGREKARCGRAILDFYVGTLPRQEAFWGETLILLFQSWPRQEIPRRLP